MLIRVSGLAAVTDDDGNPVSTPEVVAALDGAEADGACGDYLAAELADLGLTGGTVRLTYDRAEARFRVVTEYAAPAPLTPEQLRRLAADTAAQWSDGVGEGAFDEPAGGLGVAVTLSPLDPDTEVRVEQVDDGAPHGPPKTALATAARTGDVAAVRRHLDAGADAEARLQGYTALHLAVLYGHADAALELIGRGADVEARDPQGREPLTLAASSGMIADADAARVARALLGRGAAVHGAEGPAADPGRGAYTPLFLAGLRNKAELAAVLKEFGAIQ